MSTVLVIDDEPDFLRVLRIILQRAGYNILEAMNGSEGLELVYDRRPDMVILDDMMPGLTGGEVCIQIKSDPDVADIPVVMYSAGQQVREAAYIERIGADDVLLKPALSTQLLAKVSQWAGAPA